MSVPAIAMDQHNPVTPDELKGAVLAAYDADATATAGRYVATTSHLALLLAAVPGGPIPAEHPAALTLARLLCRKYKLDTPELAQEHTQAMQLALCRWPGQWDPILLMAAQGRYCGLFQSRYDNSRPQHRILPLVKGMILDRQPCFFGGRAKSLKTTAACDCAAALITCSPFLEQAVASQTPVLYLTCERTPDSVRHLIETAATRREPDRTKWARLMVSSWKGLIEFEQGRKVLQEYIQSGGARVVFLDPLYLLLGEVNPTDLQAMGARLRWLCEPVIQGGGTPVLIHHTVKNTPTGEYASLDDLSGAGVAEFARSWLLLSRAAEYAGGNVHQLLAVAGTCEGSHARLKVQLDEQTMEATVAESRTPTRTNPRPQ